ncbi:hypothetical protein A2G96_16850 [Cupriavidus nantongensis]|uniref:Uncharacterized protein n=1 Tax=Cupriavidus nantongensis TaxID=1796606 RepID=A0A142JMF8_9BURK|nr:hypothetical protein A2G96_16850 [Cupriavidus nantongensis]
MPGGVSVPSLNISGTLQTYQLSAAVITTSNLATQNLSANQIVSGTISTSRLGADVITTTNFSAQSISANQITTGTLSANRIYGGQLNGVTIKISDGSPGFTFEVEASGRALIGNMLVGTAVIGSFPDVVSSAGQNTLQMGQGHNLTMQGYFRANGRVANDGATVQVEGIGSSSNNHGFRAIRRNTAGGSIVSSGIVATVGGNSFYSEVGTVGPFTASHDALVLKEIPTEDGMVLEDVTCVRKRGVSDAIFEARPVQGMASKRRAGVVSHRAPLADSLPAALIASLDEDSKPIPADCYAALCERYDLVHMNALGEGQVLVSGANGDIEQGDFITSSGLPGIGMRQDGDGLMTYTIAQARESIHFDSPTDVRLVACYYHCG